MNFQFIQAFKRNKGKKVLNLNKRSSNLEEKIPKKIFEQSETLAVYIPSELYFIISRYNPRRKKEISFFPGKREPMHNDHKK